MAVTRGVSKNPKILQTSLSLAPKGMFSGTHNKTRPRLPKLTLTYCDYLHTFIHSIPFQFQVRVSERKETSDRRKERRRHRLAQLKLERERERKYPGRPRPRRRAAAVALAASGPSLLQVDFRVVSRRRRLFRPSHERIFNLPCTYFSPLARSLLLSMALRAGGGRHAMQSPPPPSPPPFLAAKKWISDSSVTQSFAQLSAPLPTRRRHSLWGSLGMEVRADWRCG